MQAIFMNAVHLNDCFSSYQIMCWYIQHLIKAIIVDFLQRCLHFKPVLKLFRMCVQLYTFETSVKTSLLCLLVGWWVSCVFSKNSDYWLTPVDPFFRYPITQVHKLEEFLPKSDFLVYQIYCVRVNALVTPQFWRLCRAPAHLSQQLCGGCWPINHTATTHQRVLT